LQKAITLIKMDPTGKPSDRVRGPLIFPARARKAELPPGVVDDHGDRVREVEAAALCRHRDAEYLLGALPGEEVFGQAAVSGPNSKASPGWYRTAV